MKPASVMQKDQWRGRVVVVTGATAGVGRAVARQAAQQGARVGLIARNETALDELQQELLAHGGRVAWAGADVADAEALEAAAQTLENELGSIDVWVNNAMATVFSTAQDMAAEEIRRVTEVTYLGSIYGTLTALRHMRPDGRGVIVQVGSALAYRGIPLQSAYCGAKHALRGFLDALRAELRSRNSSIVLTMVHLPAINTPQFDWARTHRRQEPRPVPPVYTAELAATAVLHAAKHRAREYWLGSRTAMVALANSLAPGLLDRYLARTAVAGQERTTEVAAGRPDNLFDAVPGLHREDGAFDHEARNRALLIAGSAVGWGHVALGVGIGIALAKTLARLR